MAAAFSDLVAQACAVPLSGWDFSALRGRVVADHLPWSYPDLAATAVARSTRVLDIDTGGGELFSTLAPPPGSVAVEPYAPNVAVARAALGPLGVDVRPRDSRALPLDDASVDLVLNRHGRLDPRETARVLVPGGTLLTQQVGAGNDLELNEALGAPAPVADSLLLTSADALEQGLREAGFVVTRCEEIRPTVRFLDVGAVVLQLRLVAWQVPDFDTATHRDRLLEIHRHIERRGSFDVTDHRLLAYATRPHRA